MQCIEMHKGQQQQQQQLHSACSMNHLLPFGHGKHQQVSVKPAAADQTYAMQSS